MKTKHLDPLHERTCRAWAESPAAINTLPHRTTSTGNDTGRPTTQTPSVRPLHFRNPKQQPSYRIVEIFESLQGEGFNTGMPSIFIRFGKCNLACPWCDTNYNQFESKSLDEVLHVVHGYTARNIIITGGEPTIQPDLDPLLDTLKAEGYFLAIETNGLKPVPRQIDYIATSPKRLYEKAYRKKHIDFAHEIRIVVDGDVRDFCEQMENTIRAEHYYLSPCETGGRMNMLDTITQLGQLNARPGRPHWQLSIQTHKLANIE